MLTSVDQGRTGSAATPSLDALIKSARRAEQDGDWPEVERMYRQALDRIQAGEQPERGPQVIRWLGRVSFERGEYEQAHALFEASLLSAQQLGQRNDVASALNSMACTAQFRGRLDVAEVLFERAGTIAFLEVDDAHLCALIDQNLGIISAIRGDLSAALKRYQSALQHFRVTKDDRASGWVLNNMGMLHVDVGEFSAAELCFNSAFQFAEQMSDLPTQGRIENNRADMYLKRQQYELARGACERSFKLFSRLESDTGLGSTHRYYGVLYRETGKTQMAHMHFTLALTLARTSESALLEAETEGERARLFISERNHRQALRSLNHAHRIFSELAASREILDMQRRLDRIQDVYLQALELWSEDSAGEYEGPSRRGARVGDYAVRLGEALGIENPRWLRVGAYLRDVGNAGVPGEVLVKEGPLSQEEWQLVREHPVIGAKIVAELEFPIEVRPMVRNHHEHWDGTGYPDQLSGREIPITARIICMADIFDALTSERSYRAAFSVEEALDIMENEAGRIIDPEMFAVFREVICSKASASTLR